MKKSILLVEDEPDIQEIYASVLNDADIDVDRASDGAEALTKIKNPNNYDLILLDVVMPQAHGLEILEFIKKNKTNAPVVILSNLDQENVIKSAIKAGAKEYIIKTNILPIDLIEIINRHTS